MNWVRKAGKALSIVVAGILALGVLAYLALITINWSDQPPSESTVRLAAFYENRPGVPDADNAYVFMLGFSGGPDIDPRALGVRRHAWIQAISSTSGAMNSPDPLVDYHHWSERSENVVELAGACSAFDTGCADALSRSDAPGSQWLDAEGWLFDRYIDLIAHTGYRATRHDHRAPALSFLPIVDGQRLLFLRAWAAADERDVRFIESILDDDLRFWRLVLTGADSVLEKMIAVSSVRRHFEMGNLISRRLGAGESSAALPSSWAIELGDDERSMQRSLIGEWIRADSFLKDAQLYSGSSSWRILSPLWQPQDLSNQRAELMVSYMDAFDAPYSSLPGIYSQVVDAPSYPHGPLSRAYNLAGDLLMAAQHVDFGQYAVRAADLEGVRRIAVIGWQLRAAGVEAADVESRLSGSELSNPYTGEPFRWDPSRNEIVFEGLGPGSLGRHSLPY